ncbi:nitrate reductase-like protein NarX [Desulfosporosinus acididurans]|uniref:Nitrate reductase-like protein NarX n=1 Tax=Desulfosporosinus acididurans TaxID=476652 RepID=A0A0J1FPL4_9FIRM|nr:respiratory nitrate reductase subunit gamma [Desulfosporosinus acididurans]KLU64898.1 nitrate reductase-like protein NarX [Desulfosporosinus acididurans]
MWNQFWWVIFPYLMLALFVSGHIYRYNTDQLGWTAKSSEFLEKNYLKWGSILFHVGVLLVFGGHVAGLLIPKTFTDSIGISEKIFHASAITTGGAAGVITLIGIVLLSLRRLTVKRVRLTSSFTDLIVAILLLLIIAMGVYNTLGFNLLAKSDFNYRETVAPWLRGLLVFAPDPSLMKTVPLFFRLHIILGFALFGLWPFTRLVHVWSVPIEYFKRSYIIYRSHRQISRHAPKGK